MIVEINNKKIEYTYSKDNVHIHSFFFFSAPNLSLRPSIYLQLIQVSPVAPDIWASYCTKLFAHQKLPILGLISRPCSIW